MYLIAKDNNIVQANYGVSIKTDLSQVWKVVRTPACKIGEYALFLKDDNDKDKFSIFQGYITYEKICDFFEMIKVKPSKDKGAKT